MNRTSANALLLTVAVSACFLGLPAPVAAAPRIPVSCETVAEQVARHVSESIDSRSPARDQITLTRKHSVAIRIDCSSGKSQTPGLTLQWNATYPPRSFWDMVAKAGTALTHASARRIRYGAHRCHKASIQSDDGHSDRGVRGLSFECHTSSDGTGLTVITFHRKSEHRP